MQADTEEFRAIVAERDQLRTEVSALRAFVSTIAETVTELGDHLAASWVPATSGQERSSQGRNAPARRRHLREVR